MALRKRGKWWYGDSHADIRDELIRQGELNEYVPTQFVDPKCKCGSTLFQLLVDNEQGAAVRVCAKCETKHAMGDSDEYLKDATLEQATCVCGKTEFELTVGVSLYDDSNDVRWLYIGCRCPACSLTGCYGDWKNEFIGYKKLLKRM